MANASTNRTISIVLALIAAIIIVSLAFMIGRASVDEPASTQDESTTQQPVEPDSQTGQPASDDTIDQTAPGTPSENQDDISMADARSIATERFGGTITEIKQDTHNDQPTWEIEMTDTSEGKIEVDVHRQTGEIIAWERD